MEVHLGILVNLLAKIYFTQFYCVITINITTTLPDLSKITYATVSSTQNLTNLGCQGFIIRSAYPAELLADLEEQMKRSQRRFNNRRYLFVSANQEECIQIFKLDATKDIKDLLIVTPRTSGFDLLTHKFTGKTGQNTPILLDVWFPQNRSFAFNANLYPDKTKDMKGRCLTMSTFTYRPYAMIGSSLEDSHGIEVRLISEYRRRRNLSAVLRVRQEEIWGNPKLNDTGMGIMGAVAWGKSDLGFCGLFLWYWAYVYVDFSATTMRFGIKCLVPKPKKALGLFAAFEQFSLGIWLLVFGALAASALVLFTVQHLQKEASSNKSIAFGKTILIVYGLFVTQSVPHLWVFRSVKAIFLCVCFFCLIIDFSYTSNLASKLVVPRYEKGIETSQDLADSKLKWIGRDRNTWVGILRTFPEPRFKNLTKNFIQSRDLAELKKWARSNTFAIPIQHLQSGNYALDDFIDDVILEGLQPMKEEVHWLHSGIVLKRNSVFLESLDSLVLRALAGGLVSHWESKAIVFNSSLKLQYVLKYSEENCDHMTLKLEHVRGIFVVWGLGLALSSVAFVYEILKMC